MKNINNCWNTIGIRGDRSCIKLDTYGHCHYCDIFIQSAQAALRQAPSAETLAEWTANIRQPRQENNIHHMHSVIIFRLGDHLFTLPTKMIDEVTTPKQVHNVPHCKNKIFRGLVNIRGLLQPCISIGFLLNLTKTSDDSGFQRLIVLSHQNNKLAFFANECRSTWHYKDDDLIPPPNTISKQASGYIKGCLTWQKMTLTCLNGETVFSILEEQLLE